MMQIPVAHVTRGTFYIFHWGECVQGTGLNECCGIKIDIVQKMLEQWMTHGKACEIPMYWVNNAHNAV